jgi:hypothetical protein
MTRPRKTKIERIKRLYLQWLCDKVDRRGSDNGPQYRELAANLHKREFKAIIPNDDNRAEDGKKLRECFALETGMEDTEYLDDPCSILEMLVAVAQRMDFILFDPELGDRTAKWFWILIKNLGLEYYMPGDPDANKKSRYNSVVLKKLVERTYASNGRGGLFPLRRPPNDQREEEIWYQMSHYIDEINAR